MVAIPARNEVERIEACLLGLAAQRDASDGPLDSALFAVLVLVNNSDDGTASLARSMASTLPFALDVREVALGPDDASAGGARRIAMAEAALRLRTTVRADAVLMTTDADTIVPPCWIHQTLALIDRGVDAVVGGLRLDPADEAQLPAALKQRGALEGRYEALLAELQARLNPQAWDPWPRHVNEPGASLGVTLRAFTAVGGVPPLALGEDRALCDALRTHGFRIRHAPETTVMTSGRLVGRASGGCADTMRLRIAEPDAPCDPFLEPVWRAVPRYLQERRNTATSYPTRPGVRPSALPFQIGLARGALLALAIARRIRSALPNAPALPMISAERAADSS